MSSRRLLLVDDSSTMRRMISTLLKDEGYEVKTAIDGRDGLEKAREEPVPDLILTDFEMPELDGAGFCRELKADKEFASSPCSCSRPWARPTTRSTGWIRGPTITSRSRRAPTTSRSCSPGFGPTCGSPTCGSELAERNRQLEAAHKKLNFELDLARKVQFALMPRPPKPRGVLRVAVRYTPANQLGGDVYDFYRLENNRLGILVADVSGHGVNSAMLSGMVKALAAPLSMAVLEPGELLAGLDVAGEQFFPEGYFCTGFYLIADEETGLVRYAGVGHPPAIVVGPHGPRTPELEPGACSASAWWTARPATPTGSSRASRWSSTPTA